MNSPRDISVHTNGEGFYYFVKTFGDLCDPSIHDQGMQDQSRQDQGMQDQSMLDQGMLDQGMQQQADQGALYYPVESGR